MGNCMRIQSEAVNGNDLGEPPNVPPTDSSGERQQTPQVAETTTSMKPSKATNSSHLTKEAFANNRQNLPDPPNTKQIETTAEQLISYFNGDVEVNNPSKFLKGFASSLTNTTDEDLDPAVKKLDRKQFEKLVNLLEAADQEKDHDDCIQRLYGSRLRTLYSEGDSLVLMRNCLEELSAIISSENSNGTYKINPLTIDSITTNPLFQHTRDYACRILKPDCLISFVLETEELGLAIAKRDDRDNFSTDLTNAIKDHAAETVRLHYIEKFQIDKQFQENIMRSEQRIEKLSLLRSRYIDPDLLNQAYQTHKDTDEDFSKDAIDAILIGGNSPLTAEMNDALAELIVKNPK